MDVTRVVWDDAALARLPEDPAVVEQTRRSADRFADELRAATPRHTGAGAESIQPRPSGVDGFTDVGWDVEHYYLFFPEYGTRFIPEQRFARDAGDRYVFL